jgi:predicted RNA-binding protein with PUA-like domain
MPRARKYWLVKSEPEVYSIEDLERDGSTHWDGVRNYQARNFMRDEMRVGDLILFYHSNAHPPGVAGVARVSRAAQPDFTARDPKSPGFDPKSTPEDPVWVMVELEHVETFSRLVPIAELKGDSALRGMMVTRRGMRLSVQPVERAHFERVRRRGRAG